MLLSSFIVRAEYNPLKMCEPYLYKLIINTILS